MPLLTQAMLAQVDLIRDKKFNFAGCSASDLVSHYMLPSTMRCVYQVRLQPPEPSALLCLSLRACMRGVCVTDLMMALSRRLC